MSGYCRIIVFLPKQQVVESLSGLIMADFSGKNLKKIAEYLNIYKFTGDETTVSVIEKSKIIRNYDSLNSSFNSRFSTSVNYREDESPQQITIQLNSGIVKKIGSIDHLEVELRLDEIYSNSSPNLTPFRPIMFQIFNTLNPSLAVFSYYGGYIFSNEDFSEEHSIDQIRMNREMVFGNHILEKIGIEKLKTAPYVRLTEINPNLYWMTDMSDVGIYTPSLEEGTGDLNLDAYFGDGLFTEVTQRVSETHLKPSKSEMA